MAKRELTPSCAEPAEKKAKVQTEELEETPTQTADLPNASDDVAPVSPRELHPPPNTSTAVAEGDNVMPTTAEPQFAVPARPALPRKGQKLAALSCDEQRNNRRTDGESPIDPQTTIPRRSLARQSLATPNGVVDTLEEPQRGNRNSASTARAAASSVGQQATLQLAADRCESLRAPTEMGKSSTHQGRSSKATSVAQTPIDTSAQSTMLRATTSTVVAAGTTGRPCLLRLCRITEGAIARLKSCGSQRAVRMSKLTYNIGEVRKRRSKDKWLVRELKHVVTHSLTYRISAVIFLNPDAALSFSRGNIGPCADVCDKDGQDRLVRRRRGAVWHYCLRAAEYVSEIDFRICNQSLILSNFHAQQMSITK